jgi:hypothetical protein
MAENRNRVTGQAKRQVRDDARTESEESLEAEQESAAAMDADVPQPAEADETTEGQPS